MSFQSIKRVAEVILETINYRPVSLTAVLSKVLESIIRDHLLEHMTVNGLFADEQHGFVPGRSCTTQLLLAIEDWTEKLENGEPVDVIYLDFRKAFDSVPHQRLINKLRSYGLGQNLTSWIANFLTGRTQRVIVEGTYSEWTAVESGIPQGTVLGPILFVLFINDLPDSVRSSCLLFADDAKIYTTVGECSGSNQIQHDLDELDKWANKWQMAFNSTKCKSLHLGNNNIKHQYSMCNTTLAQTTAERDLGVNIDDSLKFHKHTSAVVNKANQIMAVIRKSFEHLDRTTIPLLYKTLVRPHLEYGNAIWGPHFTLDQKAVERVQRRATRLIPSIRDLPYEERLRELDLPSLAYRRRRGDMIQTYKIINGIDRLDKSKLFTPSPSTTTRGHRNKLYHPHAHKQVRRHSFSFRVLPDWNSLPPKVIESDTLNAFKRQLDDHWKELKYEIPL